MNDFELRDENLRKYLITMIGFSFFAGIFQAQKQQDSIG